jgi:Protein of unknown function (DUF1232)
MPPNIRRFGKPFTRQTERKTPMESLARLVVRLAVGLFGYRQWMPIKADSPPIVASRAEILQAAEVDPTGTLNEPLRRDHTTPQAAKPRINKYVLVGLAALYVAVPTDLCPDFVPVLGWGDDVAALVIGLRAMFSKA